MELPVFSDERLNDIAETAISQNDTAAAVAEVVQNTENVCEQQAVLQVLVENKILNDELTTEDKRTLFLNGLHATRSDLLFEKLDKLREAMNLPAGEELPREAYIRLRVKSLHARMGISAVHPISFDETSRIS